MSELIIYGEVLTANAEERTISGLLLPWEEVGHTSAGSLIASKGTLTLPSDPNEIFLNLQHQPDSRVGRAISLEEREDGLHATFRIAKTTAGNDLLEEVKEGLRAHLSIEITKPRYANGRILAGLVSGAAAVCTPAFKSAAVYQLTAADHNPTPETETTMDNITPETNEVSTPVQAAPIFAASNNKADLGDITLKAHTEGNPGLVAALADQLTTHDAGKVYLRDQEIGEVFEARKVERPLINAVTNKKLTGLTVVGQKKNRTFGVSDWAGNKAAIASSTFTTSTVTANAKAKAGAVDVAGEYFWLGDGSVVADFWEQAVEDYLRKTEAEFAELLVAGATQSTAATVTAAVSDASRYFSTIGARVSTIVVGSDIFAELADMPAAEVPWWFAGQANLDLSTGTFRGAGVNFAVSDALAAREVLVLDSRAATYFESDEIKLQALNLPQGGYDLAYIRFNAALITDERAVAVYTVDAPVEDATLPE